MTVIPGAHNAPNWIQFTFGHGRDSGRRLIWWLEHGQIGLRVWGSRWFSIHWRRA